jgi:hypothetical protein
MLALLERSLIPHLCQVQRPLVVKEFLRIQDASNGPTLSVQAKKELRSSDGRRYRNADSNPLPTIFRRRISVALPPAIEPSAIQLLAYGNQR